MTSPQNPIAIFRLLDGSNCRRCNETTCMAFAAAVFTGQRRLHDCPRLDSDTVERFAGAAENRVTSEQQLDETLDRWKNKIAATDIFSSTQRVAGSLRDGKLFIKVLGKDFGVDSAGHLYSPIHVHPWVAIPILNYIVACKGVPLSGTWVPFRELKNGKAWAGLFGQRCEKPLKMIADEYTDLFEDMIRLFNGRQENHYGADISLVLHPLPRVPILICYWKPEEDLDSNLNVFFDSTAEENLGIESIYALGAGLVRMLKRIARRHGP